MSEEECSSDPKATAMNATAALQVPSFSTEPQRASLAPSRTDRVTAARRLLAIMMPWPQALSPRGGRGGRGTTWLAWATTVGLAMATAFVGG